MSVGYITSECDLYILKLLSVVTNYKKGWPLGEGSQVIHDPPPQAKKVHHKRVSITFGALNGYSAGNSISRLKHPPLKGVSSWIMTKARKKAKTNAPD